MSRSAHPAGPRHADVLTEGHYTAPPADLNVLDEKVWARTVSRNDDGAVTVGGIEVARLAEEFGTPAYFLDESDFRARCRAWAARSDRAPMSSTPARRSCHGLSCAGSRRRGSTSTSAPAAS